MMILDDLESEVGNDEFQAGLLFQGQDVGGQRSADLALGISQGVRTVPAQHR